MLEPSLDITADADSHGTSTAGKRVIATIQLTRESRDDQKATAERLDRAASQGFQGVVLSPPCDDPLESLAALRPAIRLAHERDLKIWLRLDWEKVRSVLVEGGGEFDIASRDLARHIARFSRHLYDHLPEADAVFLDGAASHPVAGLPDLSREFLDEFADRTAFSGRRYRLEDRLNLLTSPGDGWARVRCDFASTCEDLAFRLLSNLITHTERVFAPSRRVADRFDEAFPFALAGELPRRLVPRPFGWFPDLFRFANLGCIVLECAQDDVFTLGLARSLSKYCPRPVFISRCGCWNAVEPSRANVAIVVNTRAPLSMSAEGADEYRGCVAKIAGLLAREGFAFDLITPELMTTSEMTSTRGFGRREEEYDAAIYPWPTMHTPYEWRELNGFLTEKGKAVFCGPEPLSLTDGFALDRDQAKNFLSCSVGSEDDIPAALEGLNVERVESEEGVSPEEPGESTGRPAADPG